MDAMELEHASGPPNEDGPGQSETASGLPPSTNDRAVNAVSSVDDMSIDPVIPRSMPRENGTLHDDPGILNGVSDIKSELPSVKGHKFAPLPYATSRTGLVYDVRMRFHVEPKPTEDDMHPEDPRRIWSVYNELVQAGLVDDPNAVEPTGDYTLGRIPARFATKEEVCTVHTEEHYDWVMSLEEWDEDQLDRVGKDLDSVYLSRNTPMCARLAAGGAIEAARAVMQGEVKNSVAVIRPPGHHAEHTHPMGFCFFNNVPVAARACQQMFGDQCRKIFILDWDVHHGNGVQNMFYDDPNILYISLHLHQNGTFYPSGMEKDHLHNGSGAGLGKNVNIPWQQAGMSDGDYMYAFHEVVMPIAQDFDPDLVFVCAGFDAAEGDMIGGCHVSPAGYAHMTHMLMSLADGKLVVCMEGGYNLTSIAVSALAVTRTMMGEQPDRLVTTQPSPSGFDTVQLVHREQSKYWPCLYPRNPARRLKELGGERVHDLIRAWQANTLFEQFEMTSLFIARNRISRSFGNQVLATANHQEARPMLVIFHDPPELTGSADPRTQRLELHNTFLTDGVNSYIQWACERNYGVIDVNVPKHLSGAEEEYDHAETEAVKARSDDALQLALYLWDNYIELSDAPHIFVLGVGAAYTSLIELFKANERCAERISKIFFFVADQALHSCRSETDETLANWYYQTSLVFVAQNHHIWDLTQRKPKKRFGTLQQSAYDDIQEMLTSHKDAVVEEMLRATGDWKSPQGSMSSEDELSPNKQDVLKHKVTSPARLPPVGNFALSPKGQSLSPGKR